MNKIVKYSKDLGTSGNVPAFYNKELEAAYQNDKIEYITFIQDDLYDNCKNPQQFINDYKDFLVKWNLPYVFFPYYIYFNKLLPEEVALPNPRLLLNIKNVQKVNVVCMIAYGFLVVDVKKLKSINFKFNEQYTELFWLQDLAEQCFKNNLWVSNCCFLDRVESWKDLKVVTLTGHYTNNDKFNKEKAEYEKQGIKYHGIQDFINLFKMRYNL